MARQTSPDTFATYDPALPLTRDEMRQALGDLDVSANTTYLLRDSTYDKMLAAYGQAEGTARLAESLAATFGQQPDTVNADGEIVVSWRDRVSTWLTLAKSNRSTGTVPDGDTVHIDAIDHIHDPYRYLPPERRLLR
jgi:hypothetical protein